MKADAFEIVATVKFLIDRRSAINRIQVEKDNLSQIQLFKERLIQINRKYQKVAESSDKDKYASKQWLSLNKDVATLIMLIEHM